MTYRDDTHEIVVLRMALSAATDELVRLRRLFLPEFAGKVGEPNLEVILDAWNALQRVGEPPK